MFIVRYVALAALVVWLASAALIVIGDASEDLIHHAPALAYGCGAAVLLCLTTLKFVGPPPHQFPIRAGLVSLMLMAAAFFNMRRTPVAAAGVTTAIGAVLLGWYARE